MGFKASMYNILHQTPSGAILYNTLADATIPINESTAMALEEGRMDGMPWEIFYTLLKSRMIVPVDTDEYALACSRMIDERCKPTARLVILPTYACNLKCPYCYASEALCSDSAPVPSWGTSIARGLENIIGRHHTKIAAVGLFGGEPLLYPEVCRDVMERISRIGQLHDVKMKRTLTTNGTIVSEEALALMPLIDSVHLTLDGMPEEHNVIRCNPTGENSFDLAMCFLRSAPDVNKTIRFHMHHYEDDYLQESARMLKKQLGGVPRLQIYFTPIRLACYRTIFTTLPDYDMRRDNTVKRRLRAREIFIKAGWRADQLVEYRMSKEGRVSNSIRCGYIGAATFLIDHRLDLYFCPVALRNPALKIGRLDEGVPRTNSLHKKLVHEGLLDKACEICSCFPLCEGGCPARSAIGDEPDRPHCDRKDILERISHNLNISYSQI